MKINHNIILYNRIENCSICGTHFRPLLSSHKLCYQCYHGIRQGQALAIALEEQRLANDAE